ncbi:hypothetical protein LCL89_05610 [Halobacillus yeomjeoni]|uniref:hypothetical protein n=1 Tax=Halobacillus yeomjeoni TaxID=311194 RepID=UPI001CD559C1|nr:hypothetical protein [Halobacillus yeomjeoni]MCA0983529.1 hypothetical protein [Halobacillus yeomjeoni]
MKMVCPNINDLANWKNIFEYAVKNSTRFSIVFPEGDPDDENPLLTGKNDFLNLENISISSWYGMDNSVKISGELCNESLNTFYKYITPSFTNEGSSLWHFELWDDSQPILSISDFNVCILNLDNQALNAIKKERISLHQFDVIQ